MLAVRLEIRGTGLKFIWRVYILNLMYGDGVSGKVKTSIVVDRDLWEKFKAKVGVERGLRKLSEAVEDVKSHLSLYFNILNLRY